jgi:hypothetical protein
MPGIFFVGIQLLGCGTIQIPKQAASEESLRATASLYWQLRIEDRYKDTLKMEDAETLQENIAQGSQLYESYAEHAKAIKNIGITSHSISDVIVRNDTGLVNVVFSFHLLNIPHPVKQTLTDHWIFKDDRWLHLYPRFKPDPLSSSPSH